MFSCNRIDGYRLLCQKLEEVKCHLHVLLEKKQQFSRKRTRYTFSPAHLKLFESMFDVDQYPKRIHLVEMEKQFNIPEDKLRVRVVSPL